jgi:hypothetical protein
MSNLHTAQTPGTDDAATASATIHEGIAGPDSLEHLQWFTMKILSVDNHLIHIRDPRT